MSLWASGMPPSGRCAESRRPLLRGSCETKALVRGCHRSMRRRQSCSRSSGDSSRRRSACAASASVSAAGSLTWSGSAQAGRWWRPPRRRRRRATDRARRARSGPARAARRGLAQAGCPARRAWPRPPRRSTVWPWCPMIIPNEESLMAHAVAKDGTRLYYEESGSGTPLVFVHEFAGDHRSWEPQMRFFARYFRCVAFNARGFPPSDVPEDGARYSQAHARDDIVAVLDHLRLDKAHLVGLSMGGFAVLHAGITQPGRARSLVIGGCGYGAEPDQKAKFQAECEAAAASFDANWSEAAKKYALGPTRVQFQNKDPRGWAEFAQQLRDGSSRGHALTMRGVQMKRPSLWELVDGMRKIDVPALILTGDEDDPCLEPALLMKRSIATSGLVVLPWSGHTINIEEPDAFNRAVLEFLIRVDEARPHVRDPRSAASGILGFKK